ncbi:BatA domain-containing protein [Tautonia rosea]|uniref:BatA domain-containing protein n=1 Tax=Tautonia rosea TaxID=2728037 RepID=UPI0028F3E7A3|nr:BatA domain-containing protein [Tautonia rosea]
MTSLPLLAIGFANPFLLWGLAAAAVPLLLHLLNRRRYREESWAAMRFLLAAIRKNQRRIRLEHWLLLAVRTLLVVCVVLALAQPFLESIGAVPLLAGKRTHRVLVLDGTMSMTHTSAERSRFSRATEYADAYIQGARNGDAISVLMLGNPPKVVIGAPSPNHAEVREELKQLQPTHGKGDLDATFTKLREVLATSDIPQKEVLFLSDLQAATWQVDPEWENALKRNVAALEEDRANCVVVDLGDTGRSNRAVIDLKLDAPIVVRDGPPVVITARLANFGSEVETGVRAQLVIDGRLGPERRVDLPPGQDVPVAFSYRFEDPGDHVVEVRLDEDRLAVDDVRRLTVPVRDSLEVLLVNGDYNPEPFQSETDYLAQALSPSEGSDRTPSPIGVEVVTESQLTRRDLERYDVIFLCNVARFSRGEIEAIDRFLRRGGGLVLFGGDRLQADEYNANLFAGIPGSETFEGPGFLPARIGDVVSSGDEISEQLAGAPEFDPLDFDHPIVAIYQGAAAQVVSGLTAVRSWRSHDLLVPEGSTARRVMDFTDGRPAMLTMRRHRGTVVQVATTADDDWTTWPLHPSYPPVLEQMTYFAASGRMAQRNVAVGQGLDQAIDTNSLNAVASVLRPDGREEPGRLADEGDGARFLFEGTDLSGVYLARVGPPVAQELTFAVNPDPVESDLSRVDASTLSVLFPRWTFSSWDGGPVDRSEAAAVGRRGELHRGLLITVLGLLLGESTLAWWLGRRR